MGAALGIYVHVPFCRTRCRYCDFYRVGENRARIDRFLGALHREIDSLERFRGRAVDSVFFGGGTPSLLSAAQVEAVLTHLDRTFGLARGSEISLEANPSDLDPERLQAYRRAGIDRLSLGVQSFNERELALLGRRHDAGHAAACVGWARAAGFDNLSLDLMLAVPDQTAGSLRATLERVLALAPDHLSVYLLELHRGSELDLLRRRRPRLFPSEEEERRRYLATVSRLSAAGYDQYEISNFCRGGRRSRHNLKYWRCEDYLGLGPAAHSCVDGRRSCHPPDLAAYLADPTDRRQLPHEPARERVYLGLRLTDGIEESVLRAAVGLSAADLARRLAALDRFVERVDDRLRLTLEGRLVSTAVLGELLSAA